MTKEQLKKLGEALAGASWQSHFARILGVSPRTIRRWVAGDSPIPVGVQQEIMDHYRRTLDPTPKTAL